MDILEYYLAKRAKKKGVEGSGMMKVDLVCASINTQVDSYLYKVCRVWGAVAILFVSIEWLSPSLSQHSTTIST